MSDELANRESGAPMSDDDAVQSLLVTKAEEEPETPAEEPEATEPEVEEEAGADTEPEAEAEEQPLYAVKVGGQERHVTLEELTKGYQLEADYRAKTSALAEQRREMEAAKQRAEAETQRLIDAYNQVQGQDEQEPDWGKLAEEDPIGWIQQRARWDARQHAKQQAKVKADELAKQRMQEVASREVTALREKRSEWTDPKRFSDDYKAIVEGAREFFGFDADEVAQVLDHRALLVLDAAVKHERLQRGKPVVEKRIANAPKAVKPGSPETKADVKAREAAEIKARMKKYGRDADAVAWLLASGKT